MIASTFAWRREWPLVLVWLVFLLAVLFLGNAAGTHEFHFLMSLQLLVLFVTILIAAFGVVRHAETLAHRLGEPYGTLILTLSVISMEVSIIVAVMLTGSDQPTMARDTMYAVCMIVMNGLVGVSLLVGGLRHREQTYNLHGATIFLAVIMPLAVVALILPNYTHATSDPTYSIPQSIMVAVSTLGLYIVFLMVQTTRHRGYFEEPGEVIHRSPFSPSKTAQAPSVSIPRHAFLLLAYLVAVIALAKYLATPIEHSISDLGLPAALGGLLIATLILAPEGLGAIRAAQDNEMQRAINTLLGSIAATIGLTVSAVLVISIITGEPLWLGLGPDHSILLALTLAVSVVTFGSGRTNVLLGAVHLVLFLTYVMLIFDEV